MKLKTHILSWLLHHGNRYDVQFISGQECWSCNGTGWWRNWYGHCEPCYKCYNGMYKREEWNILEVIRFGKYTFHQPWKRVYEKHEIAVISEFEGYISHNTSYWSLFSRCVLYLLYRRGDYGTKWTFELKLRACYRIYWFKNFPYNFLSNSISLICQGKNNYYYRCKIKPLVDKYFGIERYKIVEEVDESDLPF